MSIEDAARDLQTELTGITWFVAAVPLRDVLEVFVTSLKPRVTKAVGDSYEGFPVECRTVPQSWDLVSQPMLAAPV